MKKVIFIVVIFCLVYGCGTVNNLYQTRNFEKDITYDATVGSEIVIVTNIVKNDVYGTILNKSESTLTYSGKQGNVIKILYRESSSGYARPAFTQELTYDLNEDSVITFRNTKIKVIKATNNLIRYVVLESPSYKYKNGEKIVKQNEGE